MNLKVVFMGSSDISLKPLDELCKNFDVIGVVTKKDAPVGRKKILTPTKVKSFALEKNIKVLTPENIKEDYEEVISLNPDLIVTCSYGQIIPKAILDFPKYGCLNIHASLLPKYRGGAPIQRAIMNNEKYTGITIMYMDEGMDTGDIIDSEKVKIEENDTLSSLTDKLSIVGSNLIIKTINDILNNNVRRIKQNNEEATFAKIIRKDDELIDFNVKAVDVHNKIRALNPNPLDGKIIKVLESKLINEKSRTSGLVHLTKEGIIVDCQDKKILLTKIKPEGKKEMFSKDYLNGIDKNKIEGLIIENEA